MRMPLVLPDVRIYRSSRTPIERACAMIRSAMRAGVVTPDAAVVNPNIFTPTGDGYQSWVSAWYVLDDQRIAIRVIASRDVGHHTSGWFKNPDYERCEHLSLSFWDATQTDTPTPFDRVLAKRVIEAFFETSARLVWEESPKTAGGKRTDAHHFRVFCDSHWFPMLPRGEVYSRELTEAGWRSWSDQKAAAEVLP